ncbi:MAG: hypothetical protein JNK85_18800 [Verrucomicrobiales bacterium]|nr:hypothetical protein [Verrucomicrobiales bacterium]
MIDHWAVVEGVVDMKNSNLVRMAGGCAVFLVGAVGTSAGVIGLFEYGINKDFSISYDPPPQPSFDAATGLGSLRIIFTELGPHYGSLFVDHELSEASNTFFNELGAVSAAAPPAGVTWEIDEPGYAFGDIVDHFEAGTLDNAIGTPDPEDVSMAMGWFFELQDGQTGTLTFRLTDQPPSGFYLRHYDPESGESVYLSGALRIEGLDGVIPEGSTGFAGGALAALAAASLWQVRRARTKST